MIKNLTYLVTVLLFIGIFFLIYKKTKASKTPGIAEKDIDKTNLSYDRSQYFTWADDLYYKMDGPGTYDGVPEIILKIKNKDDWNALLAAFGEKEGYTLTQWINGDFSTWTNDYQKMKNHLDSIGVYAL